MLHRKRAGTRESSQRPASRGLPEAAATSAPEDGNLKGNDMIHASLSFLVDALTDFQKRGFGTGDAGKHDAVIFCELS